MRKRRIEAVSLLILLLMAAAIADIHLSPGTVIRYGDGTVQDTAQLVGPPGPEGPPGPGAPPDHGGTSCFVSAPDAFVGGGYENSVSDLYTVVTGGWSNESTALLATVSGGYDNWAYGGAATISGGQMNKAAENASVGGGIGNIASGKCSSVGGGMLGYASADYSTIAGGGPSIPYDTNTANLATDEYTTVGGGGGNQAGDGEGTTVDASYATVSGGKNNSASAEDATIAGGDTNVASAPQATVSGGASNQATYNGATVGGGRSNEAGGSWDATVGGGYFNTANGRSTTVAGGRDNEALTEYATVGGGYRNVASGQHATVSGGLQNEASAMNAAVIGGDGNTASGENSLAAGHFASADHDHSFVWADSGGGGSVGTDTFNIHASGGVYLNGGPLHAMSDRDAKKNIKLLDGREVLEKVAGLPISTWRYKGERGDARHIGPMSQDFDDLFEVGGDDRYIATVDADGVALAAIQGLNEKLEDECNRLRHAIEERDATIRSLASALAAFEERLRDLEERSRADGGHS